MNSISIFRLYPQCGLIPPQGRNACLMGFLSVGELEGSVQPCTATLQTVDSLCKPSQRDLILIQQRRNSSPVLHLLYLFTDPVQFLDRHVLRARHVPFRIFQDVQQSAHMGELCDLLRERSPNLVIDSESRLHCFLGDVRTT